MGNAGEKAIESTKDTKYNMLHSLFINRKFNQIRFTTYDHECMISKAINKNHRQFAAYLLRINPIICDAERFLHNACMHNHLEIIVLLLQNCSINICDQHYFMLACANNHLSLAKFLSEQVKIATHKHEVPSEYVREGLEIACKHGHFDIVEWIITQCNPCVVTNIELCTKSLEYVCKSGHINIFELLLKQNNAANQYKYAITFLEIACTNGHLPLPIDQNRLRKAFNTSYAIWNKQMVTTD